MTGRPREDRCAGLITRDQRVLCKPQWVPIFVHGAGPAGPYDGFRSRRGRSQRGRIPHWMGTPSAAARDKKPTPMSEGTLAATATWDPDALRDVFDLSHTHSLALQGVGDSVGDVHHNLTDWHGASGDAARAELGAVRHDINAYGNQMHSVAAAVNKTVADVAEVKQRYQDIVDTCTRWKLTLRPTGVIDDTNPTPD